MKKTYLLIIAMSIIGVACQEEFEVGNTNTAEFAGEWFYEVRTSDGEVYYDMAELFSYDMINSPLLTYNSSANKSNEVWVDDQDFFFPIKSKFAINGTPGGFTTGYAVNELVLADPDVPEEDEEDGKKVVIEMNDGDYYLAKILEAKIIKDGAIVRDDPEKSIADSIYVKFAFFGGNFKYTVKRNIKVTYVTPVIPTTPPKDSATYDTTFVYTRDANFFEVLDPSDTMIISGYRQTGFEGDYLK